MLFSRKSLFNVSKVIIALLMLGFISKGCLETTTEIPITMSLSLSSMNFPNTAGNQSFSIESNTIRWSVANNTSWLTVSPSSGSGNGTATVTTMANTESTPRTATVSVTGTGITEQTINVTQAGVDPVLSVSSSSLNFSTGIEEKSFSITSNTSWTITRNGATWFTVSHSSGAGNGTITLTSTANTGTTQRTATLTVGSTTGGITHNIIVTQDAMSLSLSVSSSSVSFTSAAEQKSFSITSNTDWSISNTGTAWLTVSPISGSGNGTVTLTATANTSASPRTATITVSGTGVSAQTISVTQAAGANYLSVSVTSINFTENDEQKSFAITSNISWSISRNGASWFTVSPTSGSGDRTVNVNTTANLIPFQRTATITVTGGGITRNIDIIQEKGSMSLDPEMVFVQGGTFTMGCTAEQVDDCRNDERPAHQVTLSSYSIGKYEITQELWQTIMDNNPSSNKGNNLPVEQVSWFDIVGSIGVYEELNGTRYYENGFIYKLNRLTGKKYRLPTEAEWEYASRGGSKSARYIYSGSNTLNDVAWYNTNSNGTSRVVGSKQANELGIHDMSGNVLEWCSDYWSGSYSSSAQTNPLGPATGTFRVTRGGSFSGDMQACRVSYRGSRTPGGRINALGFRVALSQ